MFILHNDYERKELLSFMGSKQLQSGIIWGTKETNCVIVTSGGRSGKSAGYGDVKNEDGSVYYIGQGEKGDQNPGKYSNSLLVKGQKTVLFFSTREPNAEEVRERGNYQKLYRFEGFFEVVSWDYFIPKEGRRKDNRLLRFLLMPAYNLYSSTSSYSIVEEDPDLSSNLYSLKQKVSSKNTLPSKGAITKREYFLRSRQLIEYAKLRANGTCECCDAKAPFLDINGIPFLEVHHIFKLSDDGLDVPENVAAICPNCHRNAHYGIDRVKILKYLEDKIKTKENQ